MFFSNNIPLLPNDLILGLPIMYAADLREDKINLGIGAYRTAEGYPLVLNCVKKAENLILQNSYHKDSYPSHHLNKEYLPIDGLKSLVEVTIQLIFGKELSLIGSERIYGAQTIGASGALREGAEFFKLLGKNIFLPQPTWHNHKAIFEKAGLTVGSYPYFNYENYCLDFQGLCQAINNLPPQSAILLHACCHNPTGVDPTLEQWRELSQLIKKRKIFPFFDLAYQGFGKGIDQDASAIRIFAADGHEMMIAYSYAKNLGLYGERVGTLTFVARDKHVIPAISSQIRANIRANYSSPPLHGAQVVSTILNSRDSRELTTDWKNELEKMRARIDDMRKAFVAALLVKGANKNFSTILDQCGLFSFLNLTKENVEKLRTDFKIYMPSNGRVNLAGINTLNLDYITHSILSVLKS